MPEGTVESRPETVKARVNHFLLRIANTLTILRLLGTPALVYLLLRSVEDPDYRWIALGLVAVLQTTDILDGYLARQAKGGVRERVNPTGEVLDPIADKLYINSAIITLALIGRLELWVGALIVTRDALILVGWVARYLASGIRLLPNVIGKMADSSQAVLLVVLLLQPGPTAEMLFTYVAATLTVISGLTYAKEALTPPTELQG